MLASVVLLLATLLHSTAASTLGWGKSGRLSPFKERDVSGAVNVEARQNSGFWLTELGPLGKAPLAGGNYTFWRNIKDYGAKGDGSTDDSVAINNAVAAGGRCGEDCGNSFALGAIVYFPPGTYKICQSIVQFYYTQFVGDPNNRAVIKGCNNFYGDALIETDPYVAGGRQWYVNQNQFFRHIRNLEFDLTEMRRGTPTGIHWQVSQATSLQNLKFTMPTRSNATHVGINTENGSGGFVSDLEFVGGDIGWHVGTQQYTAQNLKFSGCKTAIVMGWSWGFVWQQVDISDVNIAWDITARGSDQGVGSISVIDSKMRNVATGILTRENRDELPPSIVLDNLQTSNVTVLVKAKDTGSVLMDGKVGTVKLWAAGLRYKAGKGSYQVGPVTDAPARPSALLSGGNFLVKTRPQYSNLGIDNFLVATKYGLSNDGRSDQTSKMNAFLKDAASAGKIAYFPAGIYLVEGTVVVPTGSRLQGSSWSQIMATGSYFGTMKDPKVVLQVGKVGDVGSVEIVEMMITAKGPTAGAIMVEWNVRADKPGSGK